MNWEKHQVLQWPLHHWVSSIDVTHDCKITDKSVARCFQNSLFQLDCLSQIFPCPPPPSPGDIFVIAPLDYEVSHEYYITVEATDGGSPPLSDMATVNINLTDVNDNRPAFSQDVYTTVVSEDAELGKAVIMVSNFIFALDEAFMCCGKCQSASKKNNEIKP